MWSFLRWFLACISTFFKPASALKCALSTTINLLDNSVYSCLRAPRDFLVSAREWASALISLRASQTHSLATKTCWVTCIKITKKSHIKKRKKRKRMKVQLSIWFKGLLVSLPWQGPSLGTGRGLAASCAWKPSCLWGGEEATLGLQQGRLNALSKTLELKHPMGWQHHPAPVEDPKCTTIGAPRPQWGPPYYLLKKPVYLWRFWATLTPSKEPPHPLPLLALSSSSSNQDKGAVRL